MWRHGREKGWKKKYYLKKRKPWCIASPALTIAWDGDHRGIRVPTCWDQLNTMHSRVGIIQAQCFRMCIGSKDNAHGPEVYEPSDEDRYLGEVIYCLCDENARKNKKFKHDCL